MTILQSIVLTISIISLILILTIKSCAVNNIKSKFIYLSLNIIILCVVFLLYKYFGYFSGIEIKGGNQFREAITLFALFIATIFGMLGHYVFSKNLHKKRSVNWKKEIISMLHTIIVAPIVFIPTLSRFDSSISQVNTIATFIMQFFLAFQNGFFWKTIMTKTQEEKEK